MGRDGEERSQEDLGGWLRFKSARKLDLHALEELGMAQADDPRSSDEYSLDSVTNTYDRI